MVRTCIPPYDNEIRPAIDATSDNESSYENSEIDHDNIFDECAEEVKESNVNAFSIEDEYESANMTHLKKIKDVPKEEVSERKKGLKQDWIIKYLNDNNWTIGKSEARKICHKLDMK